MSMATEWAREFFTGLVVEMWLHVTPPEQTRREADFLEKALRLPAGAQVLDVPCGGGRHSIELASRGYRLTGVDISTEFLAQARAAAEANQQAVTWEQRSMLDLPWTARFDGAYCLGNSLPGLDAADLLAYLQGVARALKPGGRLALDSGIIAESILPNLKQRAWWQMGDILSLVHNRYDPAQGRLHHDFTLIRAGQVERKTGFSLVLTYREFYQLLGQAGFAEIEGYGSLALEPYRLGSHQLFLTATRAG